MGSHLEGQGLDSGVFHIEHASFFPFSLLGVWFFVCIFLNLFFVVGEVVVEVCTIIL